MDAPELKPLTCPMCGAVLAFNGREQLFRCPHGHQYSSQELDAVLWQGVRQQMQRVIRHIQERQMLLHAMAARGLIDSPPDTDPEALALAKRIAASLPNPSLSNQPSPEPSDFAGSELGR